jgi:hypothetical protein
MMFIHASPAVIAAQDAVTRRFGANDWQQNPRPRSPSYGYGPIDLIDMAVLPANFRCNGCQAGWP